MEKIEILFLRPYSCTENLVVASAVFPHKIIPTGLCCHLHSYLRIYRIYTQNEITLFTEVAYTDISYFSVLMQQLERSRSLILLIYSKQKKNDKFRMYRTHQDILYFITPILHIVAGLEVLIKWLIFYTTETFQYLQILELSSAYRERSLVNLTQWWYLLALNGFRMTV